MKHITRRVMIGLLAAAVALSLFAALPASAQDPGYTLAITGGDNQSAHIGAAFAAPLQVTIKDASNYPVAGVVVTFAGPASGASISPATLTATTDKDGLASAPATANWFRGSYLVTATAGGKPVTFNLTNTAYTATITGGDNQNTHIGTAFALPLEVSVVDDRGKPVPNFAVNFNAPASGASTSVATFTAMTDANGVASAEVTANSEWGGPYAVSAAAPEMGGQVVTFHLTNTAYTLSITWGDDQSVYIGKDFAEPLELSVTDPAGNPAPNVVVNFTAPASGASTDPATFTATTDEYGYASAAVKANTLSGGPYHVTAEAGAQTVSFHLTNLSQRLWEAGGNNQKARFGTAFADPLQVSVLDVTGNPAPNVVVTFTAPASGASTNPATFTATTNADGIASAAVTANGVIGGPYEVTAAESGQTLTFHLTNTPYGITVVRGNDQSTPPSKAFATPLEVVVDDLGEPVPNYVVSFTAPASGASTDPITFTATTDANGVASATVTANAMAGTYTVTAKVAGGSAIFHLENATAFWMTDPLDPGQPEPAANTPPDTPVPGWWWRDTTNQNAIAQHSQDQFTGQVTNIFTSAKLRVYVYVSAKGPNSVLISTPYNFYIVGPGGGKMEAMAANNALKSAYRQIIAKTLAGVIYTGASPEETGGAEYWRNSYYSYPLAPVYASGGYAEALAARTALNPTITVREDAAYGRINRGVDESGNPSVDQMAWGADAFLGAGSMKYANGGGPVWYSPPTIVISQETTLYSDNVPITLIPSAAGDGGMLVWLPNQRILIGADLGRYLPDAGSIYQASVPVSARMQALAKIRSLQPFTVIPWQGMWVNSNENINSVVDAQRDALQSIYDQTLVRINAGDTIDEAAAAVALPADLAANPYNQELVSTIPFIVRNIYHEELGWFGGETHELASTLTPAAKAAALADALGGADNLIAAARTAELNARDLAGAEKALYLAEAAYRAAPDNFSAKQVYAQTLRKNAFMQKSAQVRNYYLVQAQALGAEERVTSFEKTGDEDNAVAFSAAEFSQHFSGVNGNPLTGVKIVTLPPTDSGSLALAGAAVAAGQEIPLVGLDGLVFSPVANWNGTAGFTWIGKDGAGYAPEDASVTLTVNPVNDPPTVSSPFADVAVDEDAAATTLNLSTIFADVDGGALTYAVASNSNSALVGTALDGATLTLSFAANGNGQATVIVLATDPAGASVSDEFAVTVNPVNDPPTAADAQITVVAGQSQAISLEYGDLETAQANLQVAFGALNGQLDTRGLPNVIYTAPATAGEDSFTYTVTDRGDPDGCTAQAPACSAPQSATATVHVTVLAAPSGSIGGLVFSDANGNGAQDAGEGGLAGVTVQLLDANGSVLKTATTVADGSYAFTGLAGGSYSVHETLLPGAAATTPEQVAVTLAEAEAKTVNFGLRVSADMKVTISAAYNAKTKIITYSIVVTNDGPADALNAALTDALPGTVTFDSATSSVGACSGTKTVSCGFGTLASGSSATVTLKVTRTNTKSAVTNTVTVSSGVFDIDPADNSATATVQ